MTRLRSVPPGRAGQAWLEHRLDLVVRGADLLDQKLRILRGEAQRLELLAERTERAWQAAHREAQTWLLRAAVQVGERGLRLAAPAGQAEVSLSWTHTMGVAYPVATSLSLPAPSTQALPPSSAAVYLARSAHRAAAEAAVQHAAALAAVRIVEAEEAVTRQRLRALTTHWSPRLTAALAERRLSLEEQEREDVGRLRWGRRS